MSMVLLVAAAQKHSGKQALVAGHKTKQAGREGSQGCLMFVFVLCSLLAPLFFALHVCSLYGSTMISMH